MPASSAEALERKRQRRKERRQEVKPTPRVFLPSHRKTHPAYRNQLPRLPEMSKAELRAMLTAAVQNT